VAAERGLEVAEATSPRARDYTALVSVKLRTANGKRWVEGAVFEHTSARLVMLDGVAVEAPLDGTIIVIANNDQPGVIGDIGTVLGRHGVNIASIALGRDGDRAVGLVNVDETAEIPEGVLEEIRGLRAIRAARLVRV
jgi:D-3-phosphoglycerate dehydrogenase